MALIGIDDEYDKLIEELVKDERREIPTKTFYINQLVKKDLQKRGLMIDG